MEKLIAVMKLLNNWMNSESFFFLDLLFLCGISIFNIIETRVINSPAFYNISSVVVNCMFTWYFCYCRALNSKDVITLRRSIQLLSHLFRLSTLGLVVHMITTLQRIKLTLMTM